MDFNRRTPQNRPHPPSATFARGRNPTDGAERDQLYGKLLEALHVSLDNPGTAGLMLQVLALQQLNNRAPAPRPTPNRHHPYGSHRPARPSRPVKYSRTDVMTDFVHISDKPCMRLIPSSEGSVNLMSPMHCVFNEKTKEWIVTDKQQGIIFINQDCFCVRRKLNNFNDPCALVLLNDGQLLGVLDNNGIFVCDSETGEKRQIFSHSKCRGLAITATGDFVTLHPRSKIIYIIPQNGNDPIVVNYEPLRDKNIEDEYSSPSFLSVSSDRMCVVDYTIGSFNLYEFNSAQREVKLIVKMDCSIGVAQCRLTGGFMDKHGRVIVSNCKERYVMLFDRTGKFLQRIPCHEGFCRSQFMCVNKIGQALVLDTTQKPHRARLYQLAADPNFRFSETSSQFHPHPFYPVVMQSREDAVPTGEAELFVDFKKEIGQLNIG